MNNTITEMKNTLEGINSRVTEAEERISELEDRMVEITAVEQNKKRNEDSLRDLWDNIKCTNIRIIGVPEGEERVKYQALNSVTARGCLSQTFHLLQGLLESLNLKIKPQHQETEW